MREVCETFALDEAAVVRELTIGRAGGVSRAPLSPERAPRVSRETLTSIWDKAFLLGQVDHRAPRPAAPTLGIADVFCGAGGLSYGVREAVRACGLRPAHVLAADVDAVTLEIYRRNFDPFCASTRNLWTAVTPAYSPRTARRPHAAFPSPPRVLDQGLKAAVGRVDLLLGGPPCGGHSTSNNRTRQSDPRNVYYAVMPALAVALGATAVIVENVPGVQHDRQGILDDAIDLFQSSGYLVDQAIIDAVELGLPQTRKRHILVASATGQPNLTAALDQCRRPARDLRWAIDDLLDVESEDAFDASAELSDVNQRRIDHLFDTGAYELENAMRPESHKDGHTYPSIYGRLRWDRPAGTVTTGFTSPGRGRHVHPARRRTLTPHEAARIQGFPDSFAFRRLDGSVPTRTSLADMIGGAVPPQIGYLAGVTALATLDIGDEEAVAGTKLRTGAAGPGNGQPL